VKARAAGKEKRRIQSRRTWLKARHVQESKATASAITGAKAAARGGAGKTIAAAVSSAAAPLAGVFAAVVFVVIAALLISQLVSSLFGFWENEEAKQAVGGSASLHNHRDGRSGARMPGRGTATPPAARSRRSSSRSGQGDHLSGLATQDNNLFGIKWSPSFASCPEVAGKHSWSTNEEYGGQTVSIMAGFTRFNSVRDCIVFRSRVLLQNQRYAGNPLIQQAIAQHDSDKMAEGLKDAGYATSSSYVDSLKSVMDAYGLRRFDGMSLEDFKNGTANGNAIVAAAESQLGVPYVWGGSTPGKALDCSGLVQYCYAQAGISLPHYSEDQANGGTKIPLSQARPGDILWKARPRGHLRGRQRIHSRAPHRGRLQARNGNLVLHVRRPLLGRRIRMRRRNKPRLSAAKKAAIAAAVTVVILAAGYAAFDAYMDQWNRNYSPGAFAEQPVESSSSAASSQIPSRSGEGADQNGDVEASIEKILRSHAWQQDGNAKATVQFRDGSFVESDGTNAKVTAMTVTKATWNGTEGTLECKLTADGDQTERSTVIKVSGNEGSFKVASDGFLVSKEYVQGKRVPPARSLSRA
jgi:hypothetical protein